MRIAKFKIDKAQADTVGLKPIDLTKKELGEVVALVGIAGAGKSRILSFVRDVHNQVDHGMIQNGHISMLEGYNQNIDINILRHKISSYIKEINNNKLTEIKEGLNYDSLLVWDNAQLKAQNINEIEQLFTKDTVRYIESLTSELAFEENKIISNNKRNPNDIKKIDEVTEFVNYNKLKKYIERMLSSQFKYEEYYENGMIRSKLFFGGKPFNGENIIYLSPGQKTLFAYALLLYYYDIKSQTDISESVLILDEPEKHLHPKSQIELIDALRELVKDKGQLWIATHSVDIISHLSVEEIIMVENDGIIQPSINTPHKSLISLMGLEGHIETVGQFINSINDWTYTNFMIQCFKDPDVIMGNSPDDAQYKLFKEFITKLEGKKILDYGAGKGRLGYTINEDEALKGKIEYYAYQREKDKQEELGNLPDLKGIYTDKDLLPENTFDAVIMCNVLHEINPFEWEEVLNKLKLSLKEDGFLMIIEDKFLPKGERANYYGYLNLDILQLKSLLSEDLLTLELKDAQYKDRVVFGAVKDFSVTTEKIISSLESLKKQAYEQIKEIKKKDSISERESRKYANLTQTYLNSKIALEDFKKKK